MQKPRFITINSTRIAVQRWVRERDEITLSTIVRGEHLGHEVIALGSLDPVEIEVDEEKLSGVVQVVEHRVTGEGGTAVHRTELRIHLSHPAPSTATLTTDEKLDLILAEVRALRREVTLLRHQRAHGITTSPAGTQTLLDFDLPADDETVG